MLRATFKSLLSRKARLLLSGIAIILGVTFITGSLVMRASFSTSIEGMFTTAFESVDVQISSEGTNAATGQPNPIPESVVAQVATVDGVESATGLVSDAANTVVVIDKNGKAIPAFGAPTIASNWTGVEDPMELREGAGPAADDEIAISASLADSTGYKLGEQFPVISSITSEQQSFKITGIVGYTGGRDTLGGEKTMWFTTPAAQTLVMGTTGAFTNIDVKAASGVDDNTLRDRIGAELGSSFKVQTGEDLAKEISGQFDEILGAFNNILIAFGAVAVFVSIFLIINTFSIIVAQRTRELALFRAMGAGRGQVINSVLLEAAIIGVLAGVVGLGLGVLVGWGGTAALGGLFGGMDATLSVPTSAIVSALAIGIVVTMLAAVFPAIRASRIPPIAALRDAANAERSVLPFGIIGGVFLLLGGGLLTWALTGNAGDNRLMVMGGGILSLFIGAVIFTPVIARPLVSVIGRIMSWSMPGKLGRRNSGRNPRRTAITATALMIGVTLVTAIGVLGSSAQASIDKYFENSVKADLVIGSAAPSTTIPSFKTEILGEMKAVPGVKLVVGAWADLGATINGEIVSVIAVDDLAGQNHMFATKTDQGNTDTLGPNDVVINTDTAKAENLKLGDKVEIKLTGSPTPKSFTVSGITESGGEGGGGYTISSVNAEQFTTKNPIQAFVELDDGADTQQVTDQINTLLADNPLITVNDVSALSDQIKQIFDIILTIVQVLLIVAMGIAVIGVVNTLTLSVLERTRELGLLRAVGMTKSQVTGMVTVESVVISVFGAILGLAVGAGLGIAAQQALKDQFLDTLAMPWNTMAFYLVAGVVIGVLAALIPAYRANKLNVLRAISYE
ncbi:ABC transporter permease [Phytomonospora endophytica]|uniref:Putative ABC transport system permease protein n=1 Tax=Phytomonospora endophytica TaxID=714109 RepID=A0A841FUS6_9ACTN|nr:FtsX-like permease family protein [Phytomonospora endophytica]MBB6035730.1 putative ABC transport system permease protein [Phytomonospora endophytica]GIG69592.1 membrane protein [Phytomonospora endophytica]